MMYLFAFIIAFCAFVRYGSAVNSFHSNSLDDSVLYKIKWPKENEQGFQENDAFQKLEMITDNNEKYQCFIPIDDGLPKNEEKSYVGPSALELLMPLFTSKICTLRIENFWTYELCHGQSIKQYHEDSDGSAKRDQEYVLGITNVDAVKEMDKSKNVNEESGRGISYINIEGVNLPYFEVTYSGGTPCDLTGKQRSTRVFYVCLTEGKHSIFSVKEIFTCEYEMVVLTSYLCKHPDFRPKTSPQKDLNCVPSDGTKKRPQNLKDVEMESILMKSYGKAFKTDLSNGRLVETDNRAAIDLLLESIESKFQGSIELKSKKPTVDSAMLEEFLSGKHCMNGGSGWWKYEICFGRYVQQYRKELKSNKYTIQLGKFDMEEHKEWLEQHPRKKFKLGKSEVSFFYGNGDYCHEIGATREVEVKLKCKESTSSISLYLLEPSTCKYVLGVESSLFCSMLEHVDQWNMIALQQPDKDEEMSQKGDPTLPASEMEKPNLIFKREDTSGHPETTKGEYVIGEVKYRPEDEDDSTSEDVEKEDDEILDSEAKEDDEDLTSDDLENEVQDEATLEELEDFIGIAEKLLQEEVDVRGGGGWKPKIKVRVTSEGGEMLKKAFESSDVDKEPSEDVDSGELGSGSHRVVNAEKEEKTDLSDKEKKSSKEEL